ncbi:helix-turn-helix transcriptional regulator [Streptomyces sp900116325]|uniref:helix-turn-helix domain-containing protein n=1 Tax=Streptomyces sp. 900116325 TaxID=3154295 RepID=UPI0033BDE74B
MGNHAQPWMFAEDRFGRRLRKEREDRGMTQSDVARVLEKEHSLKLHSTAIAKMEQREVDRPRAIRLSEARAIADMFGLSVDEMTSPAESDIQAVARAFAALGAQAEQLKFHTATAMERLKSVMPVMAAPDEQLTPEIRAARNQILGSLASLQGDHLERIEQGHEFIQSLHRVRVEELGFDYAPSDAGDLRSLQLAGMTTVWIRVLHQCYSLSQVELNEQVQMDKAETTLQLAGLLQPPTGHGPTWVMAAVLAHGLWGHGVAIELQRRFPNVARYGRQGSSIQYAKYEALNDMAQEAQAELERIWPVAAEQYLKLESIWSDAEALQEWIRETTERDVSGSDGVEDDGAGA